MSLRGCLNGLLTDGDEQRPISFETDGSTLEYCDAAALAIATKAFDGSDFTLTLHGYTARERTIDNVVLVWRGSYTAMIGKS